MLTAVVKLATSRMGLVFIVFMGMSAYHVMSSAQAVKRAVADTRTIMATQMADAVTAALEQVAHERGLRLEAATDTLTYATNTALTEKDFRDASLQAYIDQTPERDACRVGSDLIDLLHIPEAVRRSADDF